MSTPGTLRKALAPGGMAALLSAGLLALAPGAGAQDTPPALTRHDLAEAGFHLVAGTALPAGARLRGTDGGDTSLRVALDGRPALLVFTDYACESLCGIILDRLAETLPKVDLALGRDYNVITVALDPAQTPEQAGRFRDRHTAGSALQRAGLFFAEDEAALRALRESTGLIAPFDPLHRQFAHPAGLVLVDAQGRAQRILSPFALDPLDLKLGLMEGGAAPPTLAAHALLLCYGWNPVAGLYTLRIERVLTAAAAGTILLIAGGMAAFLLRERRLLRVGRR